MAITQQHFQLLTSVEQKPVRNALPSRPSWVLAVSWLLAVASASIIGGLAGALVGGVLLFAIPAAWMAFEIHHSAADTQA